MLVISKIHHKEEYQSVKELPAYQRSLYEWAITLETDSEGFFKTTGNPGMMGYGDECSFTVNGVFFDVNRGHDGVYFGTIK